MESILFVVIGIITGILIGWLLCSRGKAGLTSQAQVLSSDVAHLKQQLSDNEQRHDKTVEELKKQHDSLLTLQITSLKEIGRAHV